MFNATILQLFAQPYHRGACLDADVAGQEGLEGEGPYMEVFLRVQDDLIHEGYFETYGCPAAIACGSWLMQWIEGKTSAQAASIQTPELSAVLGGLPLGKEHCAELAIKAMHSALQQWEQQDNAAADAPQAI